MIIGIKFKNGEKRLVGESVTFHRLNLSAKECFASCDQNSFATALCQRLGFKELPHSEGYADYMIDHAQQIVCVTPRTFPKTLGGAKVLQHTDKGDFDPVLFAGGEVAHRVCYLSICKYDNDNAFYLFHIDENLEVVADRCYDSVEACRKQYDVSWYQCNA